MTRESFNVDENDSAIVEEIEQASAEFLAAVTKAFNSDTIELEISLPVKDTKKVKRQWAQLTRFMKSLDQLEL